jgi:exodeoxyribonuclease V alpha subunit
LLQPNNTDHTICRFDLSIHQENYGSQWHSVIIVLSEKSRHMTDRSLLYTAVTRPQKRLVMLGDRTLMETAVSAGTTGLIRWIGRRFSRRG